MKLFMKFFLILECFCLFSFPVLAEENREELYYDLESKKMMNTLSTGNESGKIYQDVLDSFYTLNYKYTFDLESKKDFIFDISIDVLNSYGKTSLLNICFVSECKSVGIYSSGSIYILGQKFDVNVDNETNLKLHFEYDSSENLITFSSSNYESLNGSVSVVDNSLNYISLGNGNSFSNYRSFYFIFGKQYDPSLNSLNLYAFVEEWFEFLPSEYDILIPIFTFLLFIVVVVVAISPFILLYILL